MDLSVQLYTVRTTAEADLNGTVERLAGLGFANVEPYGFAERAEELAAALERHGVAAPSGHASLLTQDQDHIFSAAERLGIRTVIDPYTEAERWSDPAEIGRIADGLNAASAKAAARGLRVGYHNHFWELEARVGEVSALEHLVSLLDPAVVLEIDAYWAAVGGEDPAALVSRLGDRVVALHLKDGPINKETSQQQPAGEGAVDLPGVVAAAGSLELGVIEFDDYSGEIFDGVARSLAYLRGAVPAFAPTSRNQAEGAV